MKNSKMQGKAITELPEDFGREERLCGGQHHIQFPNYGPISQTETEGGEVSPNWNVAATASPCLAQLSVGWPTPPCPFEQIGKRDTIPSELGIKIKPTERTEGREEEEMEEEGGGLTSFSSFLICNAILSER